MLAATQRARQSFPAYAEFAAEEGMVLCALGRLPEAEEALLWSLRLYFSLVRHDHFTAVSDLYTLDGTVPELGIEMLSMLTERLAELCSRRMYHSGPVLYLIRDVYLSARDPLVKEKHIQSCPAAVDGRGQTGRSGAYYNKLSFFQNKLSFRVIRYFSDI